MSRKITVHGKTYKLPKKPRWRKGPPPAIGWWPTLVDRRRLDVECLRFFDGVAWSGVCYPYETSSQAGGIAECNAQLWAIEAVKWTAQWWKGQQ